MAAALTIIVSSITLIISAIMILRLYGRNFIITIPGLYYTFYVVFIFVGSPFVFIQNNYDNFYYYLSTHFGLILSIIGMIIGNHFASRNAQASFYNFLSKPFSKQYDGFSFFLPFSILCLISIAISFKYLSLIEIPLFYLIQDVDSVISLAKLRELATTTLKGAKLHRYRFFMVQLLPLLALMAYFKMRLTQKINWRVIFLILFAFTSFLAVADLQKRPILDFFIMIFVASSLYSGKINYRRVFIIGLVFLLILILMYMTIMGLSERSLIDVLEAISSRLFLGQTFPLYLYFEAFPSKHDFLYGTSFPNPGGLLPHKPFPLTKYIYRTDMGLADIVATAPTIFFGEIYANFGIILTIPWILGVGILLQLIQSYFENRTKTILSASFYSFYVVWCMQLTLTGFFIVFHLYLVFFFVLSKFIILTTGFIDGVFGKRWQDEK